MLAAGETYFGMAETLSIIRGRWRWLVGTTLLVMLIGLLVSLTQPRSYVATTRILLPTVADSTVLISDPNAQLPFYADRQLQNQLQVIESIDLRQAVDRVYRGDLTVGHVTAEVATEGSDAVSLSVTAPTARDAADIVNLYAEEYIKYSQARRLDVLEAANAELQDRLDSVNEQRTAIAAPLAELESRAAIDASLDPERAALELELRPQLDALDAQRSLYIRTQENLALTAGLAPQTIATVLDPAEPPMSPDSPHPVRDGIVSLMLGLGLGLALAFTREFLDVSIRTAEDLELATNGRYPVLGVIPGVSPTEIVTPGSKTHPAIAEAFRALRTSVYFAELDRPMKLIQITSPSSGEGKTTIAANLAKVLGQAGHSVSIADCDLRRPTINELFASPVAPGLSELIANERSLVEVIVTVDERTFLLPAGSRPTNPSELLGSQRAEHALGALARQTDYTVVDTPPVLPVTDSVVISRLVDAVLVVVHAGKTTRRQLHDALAALELASAPIIGLVLNRARSENDRNRYGYVYRGDTGQPSVAKPGGDLTRQI